MPAGIPCHDARNRVFHHRDPAQREACRLRWGATIVAQVAGRQALVDGKQLRGPTGRPPASTQRVNIGAAKQRQCLTQAPVAAQRSEAVAMPQVRELVDAAGRVRSLAARGTRPALAALPAGARNRLRTNPPAEPARVSCPGAGPFCALTGTGTSSRAARERPRARADQARAAGARDPGHALLRSASKRRGYFHFPVRTGLLGLTSFLTCSLAY